MKLSNSASRGLAAAVFVTPATVLYAIFILVPAAVVVGLAFFDWNFFAAPEFVGVANFERAVVDADLWKAAGVTVQFLLLGVVPTVFVGFLIAVLVNADLPGVGVLRVLYFIPVVVSVAVSGVLWGFLFDPRQGPIAAALKTFGIVPPDFLSSTIFALPSVTLVMIWAALPIVVVFYLAGLQRVPPDIYDAAALDGASRWRTIWSITWPNVVGTTALVTVLQVANFSAASLDFSLVLTKGGPLGATRSLGLYAYEAAFSHQEVGYASTISIVQILMILTLLVIGHRVSKVVAR